MKIKQIVSMGIVVVGMVLFGVESADARNLFVKAPVYTPLTKPALSSSSTIAQLLEPDSPLYGSWKLTFSVNGIVHESIIVMNGYSGNMRTRYFQPNLRKTQVVDQTIRLKSSSQGLILLGYDPVYAGTSIKHPTYSPDNFLFSIRPTGRPAVFLCDNAQRCSAVDVEMIR